MLQKARANQALEAYCKRLEELFSGVDVCVTALFIDVLMEYYGYRTTVFDEEGKEVRRVDFCFPYSRHDEMDMTLKGVQSDLYELGELTPAPVQVYSEFPNEEPSEDLLRLTAQSHAQYAYFYLTDGWEGDKFKLNVLIPSLKFSLQAKEEGVAWVKFERKELEAKDLYGDPRHSVSI